MLNHSLPMLGILTIKREFTATNSNAFMSKKKHFPGIFYSVFRVYIKFGTFDKKSPAS